MGARGFFALTCNRREEARLLGGLLLAGVLAAGALHGAAHRHEPTARAGDAAANIHETGTLQAASPMKTTNCPVASDTP